MQAIYCPLMCIQAPEAKQATVQSRAMSEKAEVVLKQLGGDMYSVPRTWVWLGDILRWYDEFNKVRNKFFTKWSDLVWPNLTVIADICRDDLLFEVEATAVIAK